MLPAPGMIIVRACTLNTSHKDGDVPMQGWEIPIGNVSPIVGAKDEGEGGGEGGANGAERHRQKDGCLPATEIPIPIPNM